MASLPSNITSSTLFARCGNTLLRSPTTSSKAPIASRRFLAWSSRTGSSVVPNSILCGVYGATNHIKARSIITSGLERGQAQWRRNYATNVYEGEDEAPWGERAQKTRRRHLKDQKKSKNAKGRAFKDVVGYGDMVSGLEAGLSPARALRKAKKLQPKPFSGKVAMYFANTSTDPTPIITEETLEHMPHPNTIKTVKAIRADSDTLGSRSTDILVDLVSDMDTLTPHAVQHRMKRIIDDSRDTGISLTSLRSAADLGSESSTSTDPKLDTELTLEHKTPSASTTEATSTKQELAHDDDLIEDDLDDDAMDSQFDDTKDDPSPKFYKGPIRLSPEEDLESMSLQTRTAVSAVRKVFQGTLTWYQPNPGELTEYLERQKANRGVLPSQRAALTSATSISVRNILSQTASAENKKQQQRDRKVNAKIQPKSFFDAAKLTELASSNYTKSRRAGNEDLEMISELVKLPQVCVAGRSNVGKSSLLNAIMGPNFDKLRVSKTPGRTQLVQMLSVSNKLAVVDMPGYGYAAATPAARKSMEARIGEYLTSRLPKRVFILVDARRGIGNADVRLADSLEKLKIVYQVVLTKIDKVTNVEQAALVEKNIKEWTSRRPCAMPEIIKTSSAHRSGLDQFRLAIYLACGLPL